MSPRRSKKSLRPAKKEPDFRRAALQRLTSAELIFDRLRLNLEAVYIAGYAVECGLKAAILAKTPVRSRRGVLSEISEGRRGHNLEWLKELLHVRGAAMPEATSRHFQRVATWSTDLRYQVGRLDTERAREYLKVVQAIVDWAERSYE